MVQFRKDLYQGIASAMPPKVTILNDFSRRGLPVAAQAKACALDLLLVACLKACPDTSLASNAPLLPSLGPWSCARDAVKIACESSDTGAIAQLGERIVRNDEVVGSIPTSSTIFSIT